MPVSALDDDGTLAAWLHAGRADAALPGPDPVVLDVVPAGAGLHRHRHLDVPPATAAPHPPRRTADNSLLRSTTR
ncbi:hypothetical protein DI272_00075 [Streptomyces sp. Act143]|uniref:hypothetical protein n=1 Tax=Streptomyces sp. Act143 TaxID=2200760 RepID=UPI000D67EC1A|nr:hypothetical protein [Streptomyces sp. Act143]PWI12737.1 hypothetical protein DI272_00075 [Streptomyces sp. Act143]